MTDDALDWGETAEPWWETEGFTDLLLSKVNFLDVLDRYEIEYIRTSSGNFDHKLRCPLLSHQDGQERTPSMYVSSTENNFYCYGCHAHGNTISFLAQYKSMVYYRAVEELAALAGITEANCKDIVFVPKPKIELKHTIHPYLYKAGVEIRDYLESISDTDGYAKWAVWATNQFRKMDSMMDSMDDSEWEQVKQYQNKVSAYLNKQKRKV